MNPAAILLILQAIEAAIGAAPKVLEIAAKAKEFITTLFTAGIISKEIQDAMHLSVDAKAAMAAAGVIDPAWRVDPDPT
jgi:hypothetical protein